MCPPSLPFSSMIKPIFPSLSSQNKCSSPGHPGGPLLSSLQFVYVFLILCTSKLNQAAKCWIPMLFLVPHIRGIGGVIFSGMVFQHGIDEITLQNCIFSIHLWEGCKIFLYKGMSVRASQWPMLKYKQRKKKKDEIYASTVGFFFPAFFSQIMAIFDVKKEPIMVNGNTLIH